MHEAIVRADHIGRAQAPEGGRGDVPGLPRDGLAVGDPGALRAQPSADDRCILAAWTLHVCAPHASAAARMVRRTTASSTGTLYAFLDSGVASATAARAASRARPSLTFLPVRIRSLSTARRGAGATHPITIEAARTLRPSIRSTTATSQIGQS